MAKRKKVAQDIDKEQKKQANLMRRFVKDPVYFADKVFGFKAEDQQVEIMRAFANPGAKITVKAGHGVGKTAVEAILAVWHMACHSDSKTACTAPSKQQLEDVLMAEINKWVSKSQPWFRKQINIGSTNCSMKGFEKTQFITARTARPEKPDALQGLHATNMCFLIDEAFGVADSIFQVARGALSTPDSRVLMCGNPTVTSGYAYQSFHRNKSRWKQFTLSCLDSRLVSSEYAEDMAAEFGEESDIYKVRVLGEFPSASVNQLISGALADAQMGQHLQPQSYDFAPTILGVDVAWEGDDRSVIALRQGLRSTLLNVWHKIDTMVLASMVAENYQRYDVDAMFVDCVGVGAGVVDRLRQMGFDPIAVNGGESPSKPKFYNKRAEMWWLMREWLQRGGVFPANEDLRDELVAPMYSLSPRSKIILERKKDMKKRGIKSPDLADALALTFASPVEKLTASEILAQHGEMNMCKRDYDLFRRKSKKEKKIPVNRLQRVYPDKFEHLNNTRVLERV